MPDFVFRHADERSALLEIIGFWTPEYLQAKLETLVTFADRRIILAVSGPALDEMPNLPDAAIPFKTALSVKDVLERLGRL